MTYFYHFYDHLVNGHSFISVILTKWINARKILKVTSRPLRGGDFWAGIWWQAFEVLHATPLVLWQSLEEATLLALLITGKKT